MGVLIFAIIIIIATCVAFIYAGKVIKMEKQDSLDFDELMKYSGPMAEPEQEEKT